MPRNFFKLKSLLFIIRFSLYKNNRRILLLMTDVEAIHLYVYINLQVLQMATKTNEAL